MAHIIQGKRKGNMGKLSAETLNLVLPKLDQLKSEILAYYEDKIQVAYIMDAAKKLVESAEATWGNDSPLYAEDEKAIFSIETGLDALAATWIAVYLHSQKKFKRALKYFESVQHYYKQNPNRAEVQDEVFLNVAQSVCHTELGEYKEAAEYLAKAAPYLNTKTTDN